MLEEEEEPTDSSAPGSRKIKFPGTKSGRKEKINQASNGQEIRTIPDVTNVELKIVERESRSEAERNLLRELKIKSILNSQRVASQIVTDTLRGRNKISSQNMMKRSICCLRSSLILTFKKYF